MYLQLSSFWNRYRALILSLLLSVYLLPAKFFNYVGIGCDSSWERGLNMGIHNNAVFGTDVVFTYGPLGFFATRNTEYLHNRYMLIADVLMCACFCCITYHILSAARGWFFLLLSSVLFFNGLEYSSCLFLFFCFLIMLNIRHHFKSYPEVILCAASGSVVFFVKVNYGLIAVALLITLCCYLLARRHKMWYILTSTALFTFLIVCSAIPINLLYYIRYSMPFISYYNESAQLAVDPLSLSYLSALMLIAVFLVASALYLKRLFIYKELKTGPILSVALVLLLLFLNYKNAFTRADVHVYYFFYTAPLLLSFTLIFYGYGRSVIGKLTVAGCLLVTICNVPTPPPGQLPALLYNVLVANPPQYFAGLKSKQANIHTPGALKLPDRILNKVGNTPIDILPMDISVIDVNGLNYFPRPVMQSCMAFPVVFDSLNANHFYKAARPQYVLDRLATIDDRYAMWDESLTKAVLHLNYRIVDSCSFGEGLLNSNDQFSLLQSVRGAGAYPRFEVMYQREIKMNDTVALNFPSDTPVYMAASFRYSLRGDIERILFQPTLLYVSLSGSNLGQDFTIYRAVRPLMSTPVLISHLVTDTHSYMNFLSGNISANQKVKRICFNDSRPGFKPGIKLTFYKFANY